LSGKTDIKRGEAFKVRIEVEEERYARTYINNVLVDERAGNFPLGKFGFRQSHDKAFGAVETACFDDVKITMDKKNEFVKADFSDSNPFNGGVLADGQLLITGNMDHDIWVWLDETSE
jgi:alpha-L-rhamnosidase